MAIGLTFVISWFFIAITAVNLVLGCVVLCSLRRSYKLQEFERMNGMQWIYQRRPSKERKKWENTCTLIRIKIWGQQQCNIICILGRSTFIPLFFDDSTQQMKGSRTLLGSNSDHPAAERVSVCLWVAGRQVFRREGGFVSYNNMCTVDGARHKRIEFTG